MSKDSFKFLTNYLATFSEEEAHVLSEAKEEAVRAIVDFVRAPDVFQVTCVLKRQYTLPRVVIKHCLT